MEIKELDEILYVLIEEEYMGEHLGDVVEEIQKYNPLLNDIEMEAATSFVIRKLLESGKIYAGDEFSDSGLLKWQYSIEEVLAKVNNVWERKRKGEISELEFRYMIWFEYETSFLEELKYKNKL